jgi:sterol desaturase/sphingolipid hydroxylase (fatty acid hydroxylase superfamily)
MNSGKMLRYIMIQPNGMNIDSQYEIISNQMEPSGMFNIFTSIQNEVILCGLHIVSYDIWFYISHLVLHLPWCYRRFHAIHHEKKRNLRFIDAYYGHSVESLFQSIGFFLPLIGQIGYPIHWSSFIISFIIIILREMMRHDTRFQNYHFVNHHLLHHKNPNVNYGEYWLDAICGTLSKQSYTEKMWV